MNRMIARIQHFYANPIERRRAIGLTIMNGIAVVAWLVVALVFVLGPMSRGESVPVIYIISVMLTPVLIATIQYLLLNGNLQRANWLFVGMVTVVVMISASPNLYGTWSIVLLWPVIVAGMLLDRRGLLMVTGIVLLGIFWAATNQSQIDGRVTFAPVENVPTDVLIFLAATFVAWAIMHVFGGSAEALTHDISEYDQWLDLLNTYRDAVSTIEDENAVLIQTVQLLTEHLSYTFAQSHLADSEGRLFTYTRTGMGTQHSIARTELDVDNAVRIANRTHEIVLVNTDDPYVKRAHLLPSANYAVALPLVVGDQSLGVLDIQSNAERSPFDEAELRRLRVLAKEMAQILMHVRQTGQFRQSLAEGALANQRLQVEIADLRRQIDQSLGGVWAQYFQGRNQDAFGFDVNGRTMELTPANDLPERLKPAMLRGEIVIEPGEREQVINLPITRRNEVLGAMSFVIPGQQKVNTRQIEMARAVANRLSVALDNARLVEQSQAQANRERKTSEVASLLLGQQEVRHLLDTAAESFQEALGAVYTRIYIEPDVLREETQ